MWDAGFTRAIERVALDPDNGTPSVAVVGGGRPRGVCGSGMIDLLAELWQAALLDPSGKLHPGARRGADSAGRGQLAEPRIHDCARRSVRHWPADRA